MTKILDFTTLGDHLGASLDDQFRSTSAVDTNCGAVDLEDVSISLTAVAVGDGPLPIKDFFTLLELSIDVDSTSAEVLDQADLIEISCEAAIKPVSKVPFKKDTRVVKDGLEGLSGAR